MSNKRMWNVVRSFEEKGLKEIAIKLDRNRDKDRERLIQSGLPIWEEKIIDSKEFINKSKEAVDFFNKHKNIFVAAIPKETVKENLERKYCFGINSVEKAIEFVSNFLKDKNLDLYDVKIKENAEVDISGIFIVNQDTICFDVSYQNAVDKLNHGETIPDISGFLYKNELYLKTSNKINLNEKGINFILNSIQEIEKSNIKIGYFEILHPKNEEKGETCFLLYLTNESYSRIPPQIINKIRALSNQNLDLNHLLLEKTEKIAEEEIRTFIRNFLQERLKL